MQSGSVPMFAVDVPPTVLEAMVRNELWLTDDEVWRGIVADFPTQHTTYANQIREAISARKEEGARFVLLFSVKEEKVALLNF